ncbi:MATE family efflux transporter [Alterileibacterium massiliense]|uniref:MATE family efflux transporter n=1 Tax=Alterileibacterium massiliense TaxID=1870997 RepID=UPI0008DA83CC|nr:MATE family efflux transporter [Alterileibacterium massiliense]
MKIELNEHFTYKKLIRFTLPSILMMIFTSIYGVVDGFFVSNYVGAEAFASVNLIMPVIIILSAVGFMIGTGGNALVAMTLGQHDEKRANEIFSMLIYILIFLGICLSIAMAVFMPKMARILGATDIMIDDCVIYGRISMVSLTFFMLQTSFQSFMVTAARPHFGLYITIAAGVTNMVLDLVFVGILGFGVAGAAWATVASEIVGGSIPLIYFIIPNKSKLNLVKAGFKFRPLIKVLSNGASEFMTIISSSFVNMLYNLQLMKIAGEKGVASFGVIMYINFIFTGVLFGYAFGSSSIVSYHYGSENYKELRSLFSKSIKIIGIASLISFASAQLFAIPLVKIFFSYSDELIHMTTHGFRIYSIAYLLIGFNGYASSLFTALNNGKVSATIAFGRTLVFQVASILILPRIFGLAGIFSSIIVAEFLAIMVSMFFINKYKSEYHYL